jgi:hypothetical protein
MSHTRCRLDEDDIGSTEVVVLRFLLIVTFAVPLGGIVLQPTGALAAPGVCDNNSIADHVWGVRHNYSSGRVSGAQAQMETARSDLCNPPGAWHSVSGGFAGLFEDQGPGFAMTGYDKRSEIGREVVATLTSGAPIPGTFVCPTDPDNCGASPTIGDAFTYKATWKNGAGEDGTIKFIFCRTTTTCVTWGHTTFQGSIWSDIKGQVFGYTDTKDADLPGVDGARADYRSIMFRDGLGAWGTGSTSDLSDSVSRYHLNDIDNSHIQTWTDPT